MRWLTHQAMAVMGGFALGLPLAAVGAAWAGSLLPDVLDRREAGKALFFRQRRFNKVHRRASHWFGWWALLWLLAGMSFLGPLPDAILGGFAFGAFSHCLLDMATTNGVPLLPFVEKRFSLKICSTGGLAEYAILAMTALVFWAACRNGHVLVRMDLF